MEQQTDAFDPSRHQVAEYRPCSAHTCSPIQICLHASFNGDASAAASINFDDSGTPVTYDLTSNTFSHVSISASADVTLLINNADLRVPGRRDRKVLLNIAGDALKEVYNLHFLRK
jgi:hypothetical protein